MKVLKLQVAEKLFCSNKVLNFHRQVVSQTELLMIAYYMYFECEGTYRQLLDPIGYKTRRRYPGAQVGFLYQLQPLLYILYITFVQCSYSRKVLQTLQGHHIINSADLINTCVKNHVTMHRT